VEAKLEFEFGSRDRELKKEKKHGLPEIDPLILENEESRDKELIETLLRRYYKALKHIFTKYANSCI
jgi:hypothetical protein